MSGSLLPVSQQWFDNNGNPLANGKIYTYISGTSTPKTSYADYALTSSNTNPVILDAGGRATIYLGPGLPPYKIVVMTSDNTTVSTRDPVYGGSLLGASEWVNLLAYGGVGDGTTDNRNAILSAMTAASNYNTFVYAPPGVYAFTGTITNASAPNFLGIVGENQGSTVFQNLSATGNGFDFTELPLRYRFEEFTIKGPGKTAAVTASGLSIRRGNGSYTIGNVKSVTAEDWPTYGFYSETLITSEWDNLYAKDIGDTGFYFYKSPSGTNGGTSLRLSNCYAESCTNRGYYLYKMQYTALQACAADFCNTAYYIESCYGTSLTSCGMESATYISSGQPGYGVVVDGGRGTMIIGGQIYDMPNVESVGVKIINSSYNTRVDGIAILRGNVNPNMTYDIIMDSTTVSTTITNAGRTGNSPRQEAVVLDQGGTNNIFTSGARFNSNELRVQNYATGNVALAVTALTTGTSLLTVNSAVSDATATVTAGAGLATLNVLSGVGKADINLTSDTNDARLILTSNTATTGRSFTISSNGAGSFLNFYDATNASSIFTAYSLSAASYAGKVRFNRGIQVASGAYITAGTATLVAGVATVNTQAVATLSRIIVSYNTPGGTQGFLRASVVDITAGTSFVIRSSSATDTSTVNWWLVDVI